MARARPWLIALTPLLPGLLYLRDSVRFIQGMDELQPRIQLEAHLLAAWGTLLVAIVLATLNHHGASNRSKRSSIPATEQRWRPHRPARAPPVAVTSAPSTG